MNSKLTTSRRPPAAGSARRFVRMFQPRFAEKVESGLKRQTVRCEPKRKPRAGDLLSARAWLGKPYRSKQRILREVVISEVAEVEIFGDSLWIDGVRCTAQEREDFAHADGFDGYKDMTDWIRKVHSLPFDGIVIYWQNAECTNPEGCP